MKLPAEPSWIPIELCPKDAKVLFYCQAPGHTKMFVGSRSETGTLRKGDFPVDKTCDITHFIVIPLLPCVEAKVEAWAEEVSTWLLSMIRHKVEGAYLDHPTPMHLIAKKLLSRIERDEANQ